MLIETQELTRRFGARAAVDRLTWAIPEGHITALVGPNGAGKSTTLEMLVGLVRPTSGRASMVGHDSQRDRVAMLRDVAFLPEEHRGYDRMTVDAFLRFYGSFFPRWEVGVARQLMARWRLDGSAAMDTLSRGERSKALIVAVLARRPRALVLDEPTAGLDPAGVEDVLALLVQWVADPGGSRSVVIATHRLDEAERVADRLTVFGGGRLRVDGDLDDLRAAWKTIRVETTVPAATVRGWPGVERVDEDGAVHTIAARDGAAVLDRLGAGGGHVLEVRSMNLREIYLALTGYDGVIHGPLEALV